MWTYNYSNELYHSGVKGMKWGVRRYQNEDGSLTKKGQKRLSKVIVAKKESDEAFKESSDSFAEAHNYFKKQKDYFAPVKRDGGAYKTESRALYFDDPVYRKLIDNAMKKSDIADVKFKTFLSERNKAGNNPNGALLKLGTEAVDSILKAYNGG